MAITRGLCTLAEARTSIYGLQAGTAATGMDSLIEDYVSAATVVIEGLPDVGPQYAESRTLKFDGGTRCLVLPYPINAVTSVTVDGVATTAFTPNLTAGLIIADDWWSRGDQHITAIVTVGATIPPNVKLAARELVTHWWRQGQQGNRPSFGDASSDPAVQFGVPTRRLMELLNGVSGVPGFA